MCALRDLFSTVIPSESPQGALRGRLPDADERAEMIRYYDSLS